MKKIFTDISPVAFEHSGDRAALSALKVVPGLDRLVAVLINLTSGKSLRLLFLGNSVKVGPSQFSRVHSLLRESAGVLGMDVPETFVAQSPDLNAGTYGVDIPFIMVNSALVKALDDEELACVLGHELAHIKCGHVLYKTLLWMITRIGLASLGTLGGAGAQIALLAVLAALREWDRKSELSADRGGLLAVQSPETSFRLLMKLAGGDYPGEMNLNDFFVQADEYEKSGDLLDSFHKLLNLIPISHPFPVLRLKELKVWVDGGSYSSILEGNYQRAAQSRDEPLKDIFDAAEEYTKEFERSEDPLALSLKSFGKNFEQAAKDAGKGMEDFVRSLFPGGF